MGGWEGGEGVRGGERRGGEGRGGRQVGEGGWGGREGGMGREGREGREGDWGGREGGRGGREGGGGKEGERGREVLILTTNLAAVVWMCVSVHNLTNFCPSSLISNPNVPKILFA